MHCLLLPPLAATSPVARRSYWHSSSTLLSFFLFLSFSFFPFLEFNYLFCPSLCWSVSLFLRTLGIYNHIGGSSRTSTSNSIDRVRLLDLTVHDTRIDQNLSVWRSSTCSCSFRFSSKHKFLFSSFISCSFRVLRLFLFPTPFNKSSSSTLFSNVCSSSLSWNSIYPFIIPFKSLSVMISSLSSWSSQGLNWKG